MKRTDPKERFFAKIHKAEASECWGWTAYLHPEGYGRFWDGTREVGAHRFSYELHKGPIPEGLQIDHLCRNRACVNPDHLEAVTPGENVRRGLKPLLFSQYLKRRWAAHTHCKRGHELTPENVRIYDDGEYRRRICRECARSRPRKKVNR